MGRDTPLGGKRTKRKEKKNTMWEGKALWSGPLEFLDNLVEFEFPFFFLLDSQILDLSLYSPRMFFPPICALISRLPILVFPTREETVYGFPPRQMPIGHQLPRSRSGQ